MKRVNPDLENIVTARYINMLGKLRRFRRIWGTVDVDGIKCFRPRNYYYPHVGEHEEKVLEFLKMKKVKKSDMTGIKAAWVYLNPRSFGSTIIEVSPSKLQTNLYRAALRSLHIAKPEENEIELSVIIYSKDRTSPAYSFIPDATPVSDVKLAFSNYWATKLSMDYVATDPYVQLLTLAVLLYGDTDNISIGNMYDYRTVLPGIGFARTATLGATQIRFRYKFTGRDDFYQLISPLLTEYDNANDTRLKSLIDTAAIFREPDEWDDLDDSEEYIPNDLDGLWEADTVSDDDIDHDSTSNLRYVPMGVDMSEHWYRGALKASFIDDKSIPLKTRVKLLYGAVDSDRKKKKKSAWEKIVAVVLIIVIIVAAVFTAGASLAAFATVWGAVVTISSIVAAAALYLSIATMALNLLGLQNVASSMGQFMKSMEPLITIAAVITIVGSFKIAIQKGVQAAATGTGKATTAQIAKSVTSEIVKTAVNQFTGFSVEGGLNFSNTMKGLELGHGLYQKNQMKDLQRQIDNERKELAKLQEADERSKMTDIAKDLATASPNLLAMDQSIYAELYDRPYEWWSTPYHTGCIQANTVNALWLTRT